VYVEAGTASLTDCTVAGNHGSFGGGLYSSGLLFLTGSTVVGNSNGNAGGQGTGLDNGGTAQLVSCTITGNTASPRGGYAGGIYTSGSGVLTLIGCTITGNAAPAAFGDGGGGLMADGSTRLLNTIVAGNTTAATGPDVAGAVTSLGHNLVGITDGSSGWGTTDLTGTAAEPLDPGLGALGSFGGPTRTIPLLAGSPALDTGDPALLGTADQRGVVRGGGVNIGAYQASASALVLIAPATVTAGTPFAIAVQVVDPFGQKAVGYTGMVHFTASNGAMADYTFTATDGGQHTFGDVVLRQAGVLTVTGTDTADGSITGGTALTVTPAAPDHLLFQQQPADTAAGQTIRPAVTVAVVDAFGNVETGDNSDGVTVSLGTNPSGGTLSGTLTVTVSGGLATFSDLSIDLAGDGYTLHATAPGLVDANSNAFNIT
jgi:hypothetical protein